MIHLFLFLKSLEYLCHKLPGGIQLLRSHLRGKWGGGGLSKCALRAYANHGEGGIMSMRRFTYKFLKGLFRPSKKKEYRNGQELWLKAKKDQEQYVKTIVELKGRA